MAEAISEALRTQPVNSKVRFDGNFNLGHVIMTLSFIGSGFFMWHTSRIGDLQRDNRISHIETSTANLSAVMTKLAENQANITKSQDRLAWVVETLTKNGRTP